MASRYSQMEAGVLIVDLATFAGFTFVALRSDRFWPLWVAGLQLTTLMSHAFKLGRLDEARQEFERAASLTRNTRERDLLLARAAACAVARA